MTTQLTKAQLESITPDDIERMRYLKAQFAAVLEDLKSGDVAVIHIMTTFNDMKPIIVGHAEVKEILNILIRGGK